MAIATRFSLGPVQYYWTKDQLADFYSAAAASEIGTIYLGETVCSKRRSFSVAEWIDLAGELRNRGKEVVLSSLTLIESESEISSLRSLISKSDIVIEANDYAAVHIAKELNRPFVAGSTLNLYNTDALRVLAGLGMIRWHAPFELNRDRLTEIIATMRDDEALRHIGIEIQTYGRLALSHSARCFTARAANLPKDRCAMRCKDYPDGITMLSQDGNELFQVNGIQVQSHKHLNLIPYLSDITTMGVDLLRVYATDHTIFDLISQIKHAPHGQTSIPCETETCDGYWHGHPGLDSKLPRSMP